jgi:hypothetical protein
MSKRSKATEATLRRLALKKGMMLKKARGPIHVDNLGGYMLVDGARNAVIGGGRYDWTLDRVARYLGTKRGR